MNNLTIEEKAKRFDEALEIARSIRFGNPNSATANVVCEDIFPELKESEDERLRKRLQSRLDYWAENGSDADREEISEEKAWLEKQDAQTIKEALRTEYEKGRADAIAEFEKQGKQKPIISYDALREGIAYFGITQYQISNWLKKYVDVEKKGEQKDSYTKQQLRDMGFAFTLNGDIVTPKEINENIKKYLDYEKKKWEKEQAVKMIQWKGDNLKDVIDFTGKSPNFDKWFKNWEDFEQYVHSHNNILKLFDEDGGHYEVPVGAWIVKTPDGYNVPSKATYVQKHTDKIEPKFKVGDWIISDEAPEGMYK